MSKENRVSDDKLNEVIRSMRECRAVLTTDVLAALEELQYLRSKPVAGAEVRPLEWRKDRDWRYEAMCLLGKYTVFQPRKGWHWFLSLGQEKLGNSATDGEAKVAAEADYRQRILSTLSLPAQGPVAWRTWAVLSNRWIYTDHATAEGHPLYASPQPEAVIEEGAVERIMSWVRDDVLPAYGITHNTRASDPEMIEGCRAALTAALKEA